MFFLDIKKTGLIDILRTQPISQRRCIDETCWGHHLNLLCNFKTYMSSMFQKTKLIVKHGELVPLSFLYDTDCHENYNFMTNIYTNPTFS